MNENKQRRLGQLDILMAQLQQQWSVLQAEKTELENETTTEQGSAKKDSPKSSKKSKQVV